MKAQNFEVHTVPVSLDPRPISKLPLSPPKQRIPFFFGFWPLKVNSVHADGPVVPRGAIARERSTQDTFDIRPGQSTKTVIIGTKAPAMDRAPNETSTKGHPTGFRPQIADKGRAERSEIKRAEVRCLYTYNVRWEQGVRIKGTAD